MSSFDKTNPTIKGFSTCSSYIENPYILTIREKIFGGNTKFPSVINNDYSNYYNYAMSDEYLKLLSDDYYTIIGSSRESVMTEMGKLRKAIENTKNLCIKTNMHGQLSLEIGWNIENCAEVWSVRQAIMEGAKWENISFKCVNTGNGSYSKPCKNCEITFAELENLGG